MESGSKLESTALLESLIKPEDYARYKETKGRTTEKLITRKQVKPTRTCSHKKKKLSRQEITQLGIYALPEDTLRYDQIVPLNQLWRGYMGRYLGKDSLPDVADAQYNQLISELLKADFHGAKISVIRAKNPSLVGMKGIVILETKGTFKIVSKDNKVRTIPKMDSVFQIHWNNIDVTVFGKQLNARPAERSVKKIKVFPVCDLG